MMGSVLDEFQSLRSSSAFVFIVYYRGQWCPFCMSYLKDLQSISDEITAANGTPIIVTAENEDNLSKTRDHSGYSGKAIVDQENVLAAELKSRGLLDVAISSSSGYPHGMAQPAILVIDKNEKVLYHWAIVPSLMNLKGALDRPSLIEIWEDVQLQLRGQPKKERKAYSSSRQSFRKVVLGKVFG